MCNVSICRGKLQDLLEILTSKSGIMAEFSKYRFSRKEIDFQPNEVCSDLFHIKVYLTAEYERNRCFSCCHHFSKIFDFWQHSFLSTYEAKNILNYFILQNVNKMTINVCFLKNIPLVVTLTLETT